MRNLHLCLALCTVCLLAKPSRTFAEDATFLQTYETGESRIEAGFVADETEISLNEPTFVNFIVVNRSDKPFSFAIGGDYRSASGRPNKFHITAVNAQGEAVKDPYSYDHRGGLQSDKTLAPQEKYTERLFLSHWCAFDKPGLYSITCQRTLKAESRAPKVTPVVVSTRFTFKINPADHDTLLQIINNLGEKAGKGTAQEISEAALSLSIINDEAIIAPLATVLTKRGDWGKNSAIKGIAQFSTDSAADALRPALQDPDSFVRYLAHGALEKIHRIEHVLPALLQDIQSPIATTREIGARGLGATQSPQALAPLLKALDDADASVRYITAKSIGELHQPAGVAALKERIKSENSTEMRLALAQGLINAREPLQTEWLTPVIRAQRNPTNEWQFREAITLLCQGTGKNAARALASCLKLDDPSPRSSSFNTSLLFALEYSVDNGPKYYYKFHNAPKMPQEIEENRQILAKIKLWLQSQN